MNIEIKDKLNMLLLYEQNKDDFLGYAKDYAIKYKGNEKNSRILTLRDVVAKLSLVLRNSSSKIIKEKLSKAIDEIEQVSKM